MCGGGTNRKPGELSLAHCGILFLDEFPEFSKSAIDSMRAPVEDGKITISRANGSVTFPSNIMLVCAMNPCKCGYLGHPAKNAHVRRRKSINIYPVYRGFMLDRIDIHIDVPAVAYKDISSDKKAESSAEIRKRVIEARRLQFKRYKDTGIYKNSDLTPALIKRILYSFKRCKGSIENSFDKLNLTGRGYNKILKIARTIADLEKEREYF